MSNPREENPYGMLHALGFDRRTIEVMRACLLSPDLEPAQLVRFHNEAGTLRVDEPWNGIPGLSIGIVVPDRPQTMLSEVLSVDEVRRLVSALLVFLSRTGGLSLAMEGHSPKPEVRTHDENQAGV